jgi:hypothetical protein
MSDTDFARALLAQYNVTVLPGSYLARDAHGQQPRRRAASAWRWWPKPPNAWKPRGASSNLSNPEPESPIHDPTTPAHHRRRVGQPRQPLAQSAPKEVRDAVEHVIAELNTGRLRVATRQAWASGPCTSGSRRPCC